MDFTVVLIEKGTHQRFVLRGHSSPEWVLAVDDADYGDAWFSEAEARIVRIDAQRYKFVVMPAGYDTKLIKRTITYTLVKCETGGL